MQEETTQKTIAFTVKATKLTASVLKQIVKELVGQNARVSAIEITDSNIKSFKRVARKYNMDFAVKKDKSTELPQYMVFFKGRDADVLTQAFKEFVHGNEKKKQRGSVMEKLAQFKKTLTPHNPFREIFIINFA